MGVNRQDWRVALFYARATVGKRWGGYLALIVLLGLVGGVAMGAIAGARQTQSSYSTYIESTHPSALLAFLSFDNPALGSSVGYSPATAATVGRLPHVSGEQAVVGFDGNIDYAHGIHPAIGPAEKPAVVEGSLGDEYRTEDSVHVVVGRMYTASNPHEAVMNAQAAQELGIRIGSVAQIAFNSDSQLNAEDLEPSSAPTPPPAKIVTVRIVGIVVFPRTVVEDDYDALGSGQVLFSPALTRQLATCCATYSYSAITLSGHRAAPTTVASEITRAVPAITATFKIETYGPDIAAADRAIKPVSIALAVFGALAGLAALIIAYQVIGRQLRLQQSEMTTIRALGAGPAMATTVGCLVVVGAIAVGALLAALVAIALSPLFPLGPVRPVFPIGPSVDWLVLGGGCALIVVFLTCIALLVSWRNAPHRVRERQQWSTNGSSGPARAMAGSGLPVAAVTGVRFALDRGDRRDPVPVRSAIVGATFALLVVTATVTFGASLNSLVSHPRLFGWNWNYAMFSGFAGDEDLPAQPSATLLAHDHDVLAASGVYFAAASIDREQGVPTIGAAPDAAVAPPLLSGHGLEAPDQIVLGASTLASLHKHLGDTVVVRGAGAEARLVIVGTATMPAIEGDGLGEGAIIDYRLIPASVRNTQGNTVPGPNAYLIRTRGGVSARAQRSLQRVSAAINASPQNSGTSGGVVSVLRPEEIVDSHSIEDIPAILGAGLSVGAVVALGVTLIASVRRRRRDLAVLKTLGLSGRQLAAVVAWQSSVAVVIGVIVGVPLGIVTGRFLWNQFANLIHAVPAPNVPVLWVVVVALGALVLANVVALVPGWLAAQTPTATLLRAE